MSNDAMIYSMIIILLIAALVFAARLFPFALFGRGNEIPGIVRYLGNTLPPTVMIILIIYCIKNVNFMEFPYGIPYIGAILVTFLLYKFTKINLVAIVCGTAVFMLLIRLLA